MTKERLDELAEMCDADAFFALEHAELSNLIATARRVERALEHVKALPTFDDPKQMGECLSDVEQILRGEA